MARRRQSGLSAFLKDFSPVSLLFHPGTLFVMFNIGLAATAVYCWDRYQNKIIDPDTLLLTVENIDVNEQPSWARTNIKEAIVESAGQKNSILDPEIISNAVTTCQSIGWIEQVRSMSKTRDGLKVDLIYRHPIAVVELHDKTVPGWTQQPKLIPVDRNGFVMPESLVAAGQPKIFIYHSEENRKQAPQYLRHIHRWTQWPDVRVSDAAAIGEVLGPDWNALGLSRIISWRLNSDAQNQSIPFELWTDEGENSATVIWGSSPGSELDNEAFWEQKLRALKEYVQKHGPLDKLSERVIDLRSGQAIEVGHVSALGHRHDFDVR